MTMNRAYKILANSLYGTHPERYAEFVEEAIDEAVRHGTLRELKVRTKNDIEKLMSQGSIYNPYNIQQQIYKELLKGANNMNSVMNDILRNKPVYLVTESDSVPVRIESTASSMDGPTQFEGRVLTPAEEYMRNDISGARKLAGYMREIDARPHNLVDESRNLPAIKTVHFSGPCTVVIWEDKTKTIVRCKDGDEVDYEKGLAMAIAKKFLGTNKSGSNYYDIFKKWLPKPEEE